MAAHRKFESIAMDLGVSQFMTRDELDSHKGSVVTKKQGTPAEKRADKHEAQVRPFRGRV